MNHSNHWMSSGLSAQHHRTGRTIATLVLLALVATATGTPSQAYWSAPGSSTGTASTAVLGPPTDVTVPGAAAPDVPVSWTAGVGPLAPDGYFVDRTNGTTVSPACGSSPVSLITTVACTDEAVPDGLFEYVVTAVYRSWTAAGSPSRTVTVRNAAAVAFVVEPTDTQRDAAVAPAVSVALRTADAQPFRESGVPVTLAIGTNPAGGVLHGTLTVATDADGAATFDDLSVSSPGVGYTLEARSPGLASGVSAPFTVELPPVLGAAQSFSLLGSTAVVNNGSSTTVSGDVGVSPGSSVVGFPVGAVGGDVHAADSTAAAAQGALETAYGDLSARTPDAEIGGELSGLTLHPGVYHSTAALALTTSVTLDAGGDTGAVFIFQTDGAFDTAAASSVVLAGGARAANVYWVVAGAAGTGAGTSLSGNILAQGAITLGDGTLLIGRALSRGAVTLAGSTVRFTDALPPTITLDGGSAATTKDTTPTISGTSTAAPSRMVTVRVAGQTLTTTVGTGGTWTVSATTMVAGSYQVVAGVRDAAGNGTTVSQTLTLEVNPDPVNLGASSTYGVLAQNSITNTGATVVNGDLGIDPGVPVGFPPGVVNGDTHSSDSAAAAAQMSLADAIDDSSTRPPHTEIAGDLGGRTFHMGVHHTAAALALTGNVTLDAEGNAAAVFIFQTEAAFTTAAGSTVTLAGGALATNVYWVVAGAAGTGAGTSLAGTILARGAITLGASTQLDGRALSRAAVTLTETAITRPGFVPAARRIAASTRGGSTGPSAAAPSTAAVASTSADSTSTDTAATTTAITTEPSTTATTATATVATTESAVQPGPVGSDTPPLRPVLSTTTPTAAQPVTAESTVVGRATDASPATVAGTPAGATTP